MLHVVACKSHWTRWSSVQWSFGRDFGGTTGETSHFFQGVEGAKLSKQHQAASSSNILLLGQKDDTSYVQCQPFGNRFFWKRKQFVNSCVAGLWIRIDMLIIKLIKHWIQNQAQNQIITDLLKCTWSQEGGSWWRDWCQGLGQGATICQAHPSTLSMADGSCRNHKVIIWWSRKSCQTSGYHSTCA